MIYSDVARISQDVLIIIATQVHQRKQNVFHLGRLRVCLNVLRAIRSNQT